MMEPSPQRIRRLLAGAFAGALLVGGAGFLLGRGLSEQAPEPVAPAPIAAPAPEPEPGPSPSRGVFGRSDFIMLAAKAADAMAAGGDTRFQLDEADGRRFSLRLPFGCDGPAPKDSKASMRWRYDPDAKALRLHVAVVAWPLEEWSPESPPAEADTAEGGLIEGFWIERPWTSSESCPPAGTGAAAPDAEAAVRKGSVPAVEKDAGKDTPPDSGAAAPLDRTLALGQVLPAGSKRDSQIYDAVVKVAKGDLDTSKAFSLRISGRISRMPSGGTVQCRQPGGPEQRPACLVGVVIDEVAIENPATGATLATWSAAPRHTPER